MRCSFKNCLAGVISSLLLVSCSTSRNNSELNFASADEVTILNSYDFNSLGNRYVTLNELVETIDGESTFLYELKNINGVYCAYLPNDLISNSIDKDNDHTFFPDCIDGKNYYKNRENALWIKYSSSNDMLKQFNYLNNTYTLDLVLVSKEINYYFDCSNKQSINKTVNALIRNIYEENDDKLEIKKVDNPTLGITQYSAEYYLSTSTGQYYGKGNVNYNLLTIGQAINERYHFKVVSKDNEEYVMYSHAVGEDSIKSVAGKYYESLKDNYIVEGGTIGFQLSYILDL